MLNALVLKAHFTGLPSVTLELQPLALLRRKKRTRRGDQLGRPGTRQQDERLETVVRLREGITAAQTRMDRYILRLRTLFRVILGSRVDTTNAQARQRNGTRLGAVVVFWLAGVILTSWIWTTTSLQSEQTWRLHEPRQRTCKFSGSYRRILIS